MQTIRFQFWFDATDLCYSRSVWRELQILLSSSSKKMSGRLLECKYSSVTSTSCTRLLFICCSWKQKGLQSSTLLNEQGPNLMNLSYFAKLPASGSNLHHRRFKVKDSGKIWIGNSNLNQRDGIQFSYSPQIR